MAARRHRSSATPLALAYAALVVYASLYPFTGWRWPPGQALATLAQIVWPPWRDDFDFWSNLAGYLPLGALLMIAARRSGWGVGPSLALALGGPSALSYLMEVLQHFVPNRHPSLKDLAMNSAGALCGALLAWSCHAVGLVDRWHALRERWFTRDSAGALALLALVVLVPPLRTAFQFTALHPIDVAVCTGAALGATAWFETIKWARGRRHRSAESGAGRVR